MYHQCGDCGAYTVLNFVVGGAQELMAAEARPSSEGSKRKRRLPSGMSDYQAAWITEEELHDNDESSSEEDDNMAGGDAEPRSGDLGVSGAVSMADLEEEDDQTDDMQVLPCNHDAVSARLSWHAGYLFMMHVSISSEKPSWCCSH